METRRNPSSACRQDLMVFDPSEATLRSSTTGSEGCTKRLPASRVRVGLAGAANSSAKRFWSEPSLVTFAQPSTGSKAALASVFAARSVAASNRL